MELNFFEEFAVLFGKTTCLVGFVAAIYIGVSMFMGV